MLGVIVKRNPWMGNGFGPGTWVECFDDGCRRVTVTSVNNRLQVVREEGLIVPQSELAPYMMRALKRGLDK